MAETTAVPTGRSPARRLGVTVRTYQPGDEAAQADVFNAAAAGLTGFRPATAEEVRRRFTGRDFDPAGSFYLERDGRVVGYASVHPDGRVGFPWCLPGHEAGAEELWQVVLAAARDRGLTRLWAAYRADWPGVAAFFTRHGLPKARDVFNYTLDLINLPTLVSRPSLTVTELRPDDLPALRELAPGLIRPPEEELRRHLFANPFFEPRALVALRRRDDGALRAAGLLIEDASFADPHQLDPVEPVFRHGAFGTEGLPTRRVNGLFSFVAPPGREAQATGLDLLGLVAHRLDDTVVETLTAQVSSDAPHLVQFYDRYFRRQGSFPVFEGEIV
jgi:hypothetical protein